MFPAPSYDSAVTLPDSTSRVTVLRASSTPPGPSKRSSRIPPSVSRRTGLVPFSVARLVPLPYATLSSIPAHVPDVLYAASASTAYVPEPAVARNCTAST
ncbi:unannotated protein [freshwater metagenome]|uniref:Unannotated protein n=1 Tax=freshwater metagenome TaxID=449393 RepID=A0A6J7CRS2_9ZZZZ